VTAANGQIEPIAAGWRSLMAKVDSLSPAELELKGEGQWAVKDHLVHVAAWELSLLALLDGKDMRTGMGVAASSEGMDAINEAIWLAHRHEPADEALAYSRRSHDALMARLSTMSDADLRRSYNHYQPNDPRDPGDDRPVVEWVGPDTYEHYAEHAAYIDTVIKESSASR